MNKSIGELKQEIKELKKMMAEVLFLVRGFMSEESETEMTEGSDDESPSLVELYDDEDDLKVPSSKKVREKMKNKK